MKKILVINTAYKTKGGEDTNIIDEIAFLKNFYEVKFLEFNNKDRLSIFDFIAFLTNSNIKSNKILKDTINEFNPDIAYVHNTWFKANLGIFKTLKKNKIKVFLKIHNFRYYCCNFFLIKNHLNNSEFCYMCNLHKKNKIFNKYYEKSYLKSIFGIIYGKKYFRLIKYSEINLLVMTNFHKDFLINLGFRYDKINIFRNPISSLSEDKYNQNSNYLVYAGRLSSDKGVEELIKAWTKSNLNKLSLKIIGEGELLHKLSNKYKSLDIEFLGLLDNKTTLDLIKKSRGVVTATRMYEGQPRLLCEASINGIPSLFPDFGGMGEFFPKDYILKFEQFNYEDLSNKMGLFESLQDLKSVSFEINEYAKEKLSEEVLKKSLYKIFE